MEFTSTGEGERIEQSLALEWWTGRDLNPRLPPLSELAHAKAAFIPD